MQIDKADRVLRRVEGSAAAPRRLRAPPLPHLQGRPPAQGQTLQDLRQMRRPGMDGWMGSSPVYQSLRNLMVQLGVLEGRRFCELGFDTLSSKFLFVHFET